jgi:hypothetical protein
MATNALNRARLEQSRAELQRLRQDLKEWDARRRGPDLLERQYRGQHDSQLAAVVAEVSDAIDAVADSLTIDPAATATPQLYQRLTRIDRQIVWIRRAWDFFRAKFDQRDSPSLFPALAAADEVLWSCYKPFFQNAGAARPPAPLAYIEFDYLPSAILASQGHQIERLDELDEGPLAGYFASLPLPVLRLPPAIVTAPWTLVLIAHEMGHFVMPYLDRDGARFLDNFAALIRTAVDEAQGSEADAKNWQRWAPEIFADWFATANCGIWAIWGIAQYEITVESRMRTPKTFYPSPEVRLLLLVEIAKGLGLSTAPLDGVIETPKIETVDHAIARRVAAATLKPLPRFDETLADLVSFLLDEHQETLQPLAQEKPVLTQWASGLVGKDPQPPGRNLRHARLLAAAAARAWKEMCDQPEEQTQIERAARIRELAFDWIIASAEPGTRAAAQTAELKPVGRSLRARLDEASDDELLAGREARG